jgi:glycine/D-amino acid oxidase-like deaminating enzyme
MEKQYEEPSSHWQQTAPVLPFSDPMPSQADLVILGAGWLGTSVAYWAAQTGAFVLLLDRQGFAAEATGRNAGFLGCGPDEPYQDAVARFGEQTARTILEITLENRALLRHVLEQEAIACQYREPGHVHLALSEQQLAEHKRRSEQLQQEGIAALVLDRDQLQQHISTPLGDAIRGGLFVPENGLLHSAQLVQGVGQVAQRAGVQCIQATAFRMTREHTRVRLETNKGSLLVGGAVVALNAWTGDLVPSLAQTILPVRGQMLAYEPLPAVFRPGITAAISDSEVYWQQTPEGVVLLGGRRTAAPGHDIGVRSNAPSLEVQQALERVFPRLFPQLAHQLQVLHRWAGQMAFTSDLIPVIDQVPDLPNVWVMGGFSGHGMPYGLRIGQLVAEAVTTQTRPPQLAPFRLDRATLQ